MLAVERCLVEKLPSLFPQEVILDLGEEQLAHLATESEAMTEERTRLRDKLAVLEDAKSDLKHLDMCRALSQSESTINST